MKDVPGDNILGSLVKSNKIITYSVSPILFHQNRVKMKSSIGNISLNEPPECRYKVVHYINYQPA